jgi:Sulfotransferase family
LTAVCIAGMNRSGTSMVARMLHAAGLYLGESRSLTAPDPSNGEAHWEHLSFLALNNCLLDHWGAGWDFPPRNAVDVHDPELGPIRGRARQLISEFDGHAAWGWKDPRSCLTLPFWLDVIQGLKIVVPVRNPIEVAQSLKKRNASSSAFSMDLWYRYHSILLRTCPPNQRLIVHYESCLARPHHELNRMLRFVDLPAPSALARFAASTVKLTLRHSRYSITDLSELGVDDHIVRMYGDLCREAGYGPAADADTEPDVLLLDPPSLETLPKPATELPDDRRWWRKRIGHPARVAVLRAVGAEWVVKSQENELLELRRQLEERIKWERQIESRLERTKADS